LHCRRRVLISEFEREFEFGPANDATLRDHPRADHEGGRTAFAERGYEGTSIRAIVAKARVNQAAINYHFAGKDGLYREVLRAAFARSPSHQLAHAEEAKAMSREQALGEFVPPPAAAAGGARTSSAATFGSSTGKRCGRRRSFASS